MSASQTVRVSAGRLSLPERTLPALSEQQLERKLHNPGGFACVTNPNVPLFTLPSGVRNWAWLKALNSSARNSRFMPSLMSVSFSRAMSQLFSPGPEKKRRLAVPKVPNVSGLNNAVLKYGVARARIADVQ